MDAEIKKPIENCAVDKRNDDALPSEESVGDTLPSDVCTDEQQPATVLRPNGKLRPNKGKIRGKYPTCLLR